MTRQQLLRMAHNSLSYADMGSKQGISRQRIHQLLQANDCIQEVKDILKTNRVNHRKQTEIPAVYKLTFRGATGCYIGSTCNLRERKTGHLRMLRTGDHYNSKVQEAYNTFGEDAIEWTIIHNPDNTDDLRILEEETINSTPDAWNVFAATLDPYRFRQQSEYPHCYYNTNQAKWMWRVCLGDGKYLYKQCFSTDKEAYEDLTAFIDKNPTTIPKQFNRVLTSAA